MKMMETANSADIALILRCLLDRVPILIIGKEASEVDELINDLASFISFRNEVIFYTDFVSNDEYTDITSNEENDYEIARSVFLSHCAATKIAAKEIGSFKSWILGTTQDFAYDEDSNEIKQQLYEKHAFFLVVKVFPNFMEFIMEGKQFPKIDLSFEKWLYKQAINGTEDSIERMKRVLAKKVKLNAITKDQLKSLIDFEMEELELKRNIFKKELLAFYQACKRASFILNRMVMLQQMDMPATIAEKTLLATISYEQAPVQRILEFILNEWNQSYPDILKSGRTSNFGDLIEGMWG